MSSVRKGKVLKLLSAVLSTAIVFCSAAFLSAPAVYAEGDYASVGDRYFHTDTAGATVESFLNKAPLKFPSYRGVLTEMTVPEGTENASLMFNAVVAPSERLILTYDINGKDASGNTLPVADMVVTTYSAVSDPTKQFSIVQVNRDNRTWITVSLTDDVYYSEGFSYLNGTEQKTIGLQDGVTVNDIGYTVWSAGEYNWGAIYGGEFQWFLTAEGELKMNDSTVIVNLLSDEWLAESRTNLAGSVYESMYTEEYTQSVIDALNGADGALVTIDYYGLKDTRAAINIRQINGQWLTDDGNKPINVSANTTGYVLPKTDTLYIGETYKPSELFTRYSIYRDAEGTDISYNTGFRGTDVWADAGGVWFDFGYMRDTRDAEFTLTEEGEYKIIINTADGAEFAGPGRYWSTEQIFTFKVEYPVKADFEVNGEIAESIGGVAGAKITLPAAPAFEGVAFVGWLSDGKLYGAGAEYTLGESAVFKAVFIDFTYDGTASVRLGEPYGIRFVAKFDKATIDALDECGVTYTFGTMITSDGSSKSVDIVCDRAKLYSEDGEYYNFNAVLVNIREENLTRIYHANPYLKITYADGQTAIVNATVEDTSGRSYAGVITAAYNDVQPEQGGDYQYAVEKDGVTVYAPCSAESYAIIARLYASLPQQSE